MAKQMPSKVLFVSKKMRQPFGLLRTKIVNIGSSKINELITVIFVLSYLTASLHGFVNIHH